MSHPHLACIPYLKPNSPVEIYSLSLFPVFSPCQAFKSVVQSRPHVSIHSNPHITPCTHAITPSPSSHPRSLRVWILVAWLFAFVCHPAITLSGSPTTCAGLLFGLRVRLASVVIGYVFVLPALICFCDKPSPVPSIFLPALKHILPTISAITVTIIYTSHRSKQVLCFVVTYYTSCSITCSFPAIPFFQYPHCNVFSFFLFLSFLFLSSSYIYRALRMYCIL